MRVVWMLALFAIACGGTTETTRRQPLSHDTIAAFGAERSGPTDEAPEATGATAIELADGERLEELRALIRFDAGGGSDPSCALYALQVRGSGLSEGRATVGCESVEPTAQISLVPVDEDRGPRLIAALSGARLDTGTVVAGPSPRAVHIWLTTDRREVDGNAAPIRWPSPDGEATEAPVERSPANLSEVWEAVMYPHRYR
jgi:hypothetical protein